MSDDVEEDSKLKGPKIFGRYIAEIPCFRGSFMYGISGGIASGLAYFMYSSKPRLSSHVGMTGFVATTISCWLVCRYNWEKQQSDARVLREFIKEYQMQEGFQKNNMKEDLTVSSV